MTITFRCECGQKLHAKDELAGRELRCPTCSETVVVPHDSATVAGADEETADGAGPDERLVSVGDQFTQMADVEEEKTPLPPTQEPTRDQPKRSSKDAPQIEGYEILRTLGRGGMGVVYQARDVRLKRLVALKMILAGGHASPKKIARFQAEAEAVARLRHPNVVQIYEIGSADEHPYLSLEFAEGGSLDDRLGEGQLAPRESAELIRTVAEAIQHCHDQGIVHRDLKPANVLICEGVPKITDFGLAMRLEGDDIRQTKDGSVIGTPSYMSPEQAEGKTAEVGPATDIYALGAMLYELLTGQVPFAGETTVKTLQMVQHDSPVAPTKLREEIHRDLETICLKCLEKSPSDRYASAGELAEDLRRFLDGEPILARPVGRVERVVKWCKRKPVVSGLAAAMMLLAVFGTWEFMQAREGEKLKELQREIAIRRKYAADMREALEERKPLEHLDALRPPPGQLDPRGLEWYHYRVDREYRKNIDRQRNPTGWKGDEDLGVDRLELDGMSIHGPIHWSPDGEMIAFAVEERESDAHSIVVCSVDPKLTKLASFGEYEQRIRDFTWSPDGTQIAVAPQLRSYPRQDKSAPVDIWDVRSEERAATLIHKPRKRRPPVTEETDVEDANVLEISWSPSGEYLATRCEGGESYVTIWDARSRRVSRAYTREDLRELLVDAVGEEEAKYGQFGISWSPDGDQMAGKDVVWDPLRGEILFAFPRVVKFDEKYNPYAGEYQPERTYLEEYFASGWRPDGRRLAGLSDRGFYVWDAATFEIVVQPNEEVRPNLSDVKDVKALTWLPWGKRLHTDRGTLYDTVSFSKLPGIAYPSPTATMTADQFGSAIVIHKPWQSKYASEWPTPEVMRGLTERALDDVGVVARFALLGLAIVLGAILTRPQWPQWVPLRQHLDTFVVPASVPLGVAVLFAAGFVLLLDLPGRQSMLLDALLACGSVAAAITIIVSFPEPETKPARAKWRSLMSWITRASRETVRECVATFPVLHQSLQERAFRCGAVCLSVAGFYIFWHVLPDSVRDGLTFLADFTFRGITGLLLVVIGLLYARRLLVAKFPKSAAALDQLWLQSSSMAVGAASLAGCYLAIVLLTDRNLVADVIPHTLLAAAALAGLFAGELSWKQAPSADADEHDADADADDTVENRRRPALVRVLPVCGGACMAAGLAHLVAGDLPFL